MKKNTKLFKILLKRIRENQKKISIKEKCVNLFIIENIR